MMTTRKTTTPTTTLRRCAGSTRFGIEAHEAPVADFPKQPSRKDGLGTMCAEHWKAYVRGLAADRRARPKAVALATTDSDVPLSEAGATKIDAAIARGRSTRRVKSTALDPEVAKAEALIAEVDALPGPEHVKRIGQPDVQAALERSATARRMLAD